MTSHTANDSWGGSDDQYERQTCSQLHHQVKFIFVEVSADNGSHVGVVRLFIGLSWKNIAKYEFQQLLWMCLSQHPTMVTMLWSLCGFLHAVRLHYVTWDKLSPTRSVIVLHCRGYCTTCTSYSCSCMVGSLTQFFCLTKLLLHLRLCYLYKQEREFSNTNFEIRRKLPAFWLNSSVIIRAKVLMMMTEAFSCNAGKVFPISMLVSENFLSHLSWSQLRNNRFELMIFVVQAWNFVPGGGGVLIVHLQEEIGQLHCADKGVPALHACRSSHVSLVTHLQLNHHHTSVRVGWVRGRISLQD